MKTLTLSQFTAPARQPARGAVLLFGGDLCPVGRYHRAMLDGGRVFDDALSALWRGADFSMVNLEAPLCDAGLPSDSPGGFGLRADPQIAAFIQRVGITAVGLANNHIRDFCDEGVAQTLRHLRANRVLCTGAGMNLAEAEEPLAVDVNGLRVGIWALAEKELNVASDAAAGSSWFRPEEDAARVAATRSRFDFIVVYLHAGHEFTTAPSPRMRSACRSLIDAGVDAVIAHHPHVIQGVERYKDGLIAYSLGNLVFDTPYVSAYEGTDVGYLVRITASARRIDGVEIIPYCLLKDGQVSTLDGDAFNGFVREFDSRSRMITDDAAFALEWEENVRFRWATEYARIVNDFSARFDDPANGDYARRARNLFTCPTHVEMLEKAFLMLEAGKLQRRL